MLSDKKIHIFDLDGTLVDSMPYWSESILSFLDEIGFNYPTDIIKILTPLGIIEGAKYLNSIGLNIDPETVRAETERIMLGFYENTIATKPYIKDYLEKLKNNGCRLFILTASERRFALPCLKRNGILDLFEKIFSCSDFSLSKSKPDIYFAAAKEIEADIKDIVFYDDNLGSISGAKSAGLTTIGVYDKSSEEDIDKIKAIADGYIRSFSQLI